MIRKQPWFERKFPTDLPAALFPVVVERLRGTPARMEDRLSSLQASVLTRRSGSNWSTQENAGHLLDLEPLWLARVEDLLARRPEMTAADLTNRRTHEADHNAAQLRTILSGFRQARSGLVRRLEAVESRALTHTAQHPRMRTPMTLVDHVFFVAEHDDYHLARITELLIEFGTG